MEMLIYKKTKIYIAITVSIFAISYIAVVCIYNFLLLSFFPHSTSGLVYVGFFLQQLLKGLNPGMEESHHTQEDVSTSRKLSSPIQIYSDFIIQVSPSFFFNQLMS